MTEDRPLSAITLIANRDHPRYVDKQSDDEIMKTLAIAKSCLRPAHDYLKQTICELGKLGWRATEVHVLGKRVSRYNQE